MFYFHPIRSKEPPILNFPTLDLAKYFYKMAATRSIMHTKIFNVNWIQLDRVNRPLNTWTRLSVRIIGAIKRQFFHMVTHVFDSNLSQEILAIDSWGAVICSLGHAHKHMLTILPTIWRPGFN